MEILLYFLIQYFIGVILGFDSYLIIIFKFQIFNKYFVANASKIKVLHWEFFQ